MHISDAAAERASLEVRDKWILKSRPRGAADKFGDCFLKERKLILIMEHKIHRAYKQSLEVFRGDPSFLKESHRDRS